ncbi:MAG: NfeD family protein [Oceanospirillaceae bacterium]|nr:NfeD family protein [Oceanospirillaceae bacterium]
MSVGGEIWDAESAKVLKIGDRVQVRGIDGLRLTVSPVTEPAKAAIKS